VTADAATVVTVPSARSATNSQNINQDGRFLADR
jgi:hypothetical protein